MHFKHLFQIIILSFVTIAFSSCKKEAVPPPQPSEAQANANEAVPVADNDASANSNKEIVKADSPDTPPIDKSAAVVDSKPIDSPDSGDSALQPQAIAQNDPCFSWQDNPLFQDKHAFLYKVRLETEAYDIEAEDFECDDSHNCTRDVTFELTCNVVRIGQDRGYCASKLECKAKPENYQNEIPEVLEGYWFRDMNGFYLLNSNSFKISDIEKKTGNCEKTKYVDCKPGTLAHDFDYFSELVPTIPTLKEGKVDETDDQEDSDITRSWEVNVKDNAYCSEYMISGPDMVENNICMSDTQGIISFQDTFSGGINRDITGKLVK